MTSPDTITPALQKQLIQHAKQRVALKCPQQKRSFTSEPVVSSMNPDAKPADIRYIVSWSDGGRTLSVDCILPHPMGCMDMGVYFSDHNKSVFRKEL